jgi:magnesium transporter
MRRLFGRASRKAGSLPGTLLHLGEHRTDKVRVSALSYDAAGSRETAVESVADLTPPGGADEVTWINVDGIHDPQVIEQIGRRFDLHPLLLEDITDIEHRPKVEDYGTCLFVVMKMLYYDQARQEVVSEQVSIVFGPRFVISFQERPGDVFEPIRQRIRNGKGRIRTMGADYLAYLLIDAVVDGYFIVEEKLGDQIEDLEDELMSNPDRQTVQRIYEMKREVMGLRRSVWPLREAIGALQREESSLIAHTTAIHLRDVYDHTIQVIDTVENFRDLLSGMLDLYLSSISNRMNEVMKVLTIIATIFMPLTFVAGVYGMNFRYMPELGLRWAYPAALAVMVVIAGGMAVYFRRKRWL